MRSPVAVLAILAASLTACASAPPSNRQREDARVATTSGTTSFVLDGNRVYADLDFLLPNGSTHRAYAYVDMGSANAQLSAPLYDSLGVANYEKLVKGETVAPVVPLRGVGGAE